MSGAKQYTVPEGPLGLLGPVEKPAPGTLPLRGDLAHIGGATSRSEGVEILEDLFRVSEEALHDARAREDHVKVAAEIAL